MTPKIIHDNQDIFYDSNKKKMNHSSFYKFQRKRLNIYMDGGEPKGGKWSFDEDNRLKIPKDLSIPNIKKWKRTIQNQKIIDEAIHYTQTHFSSNYGSLEYFVYPIDFEDSKEWLFDFIKNKFELFGIYEDAVVHQKDSNPFLFHSALSPMMNIGLLTEKDIIQWIKPYENKIPPSSYEGFIRQCIGWRNYIYTSYILFGEEMRNSNFLNHTRKINKNMRHKLWNGDTNIQHIDTIIQKINKYAYAHHIERLMYLGNFLSYCLIHPYEVYKIFMEWTIDAYDWVMIPNVMGMSQYACQNQIMNRPYMCSSNYILKMSDYKKGEWTTIWNDLYYYYIHTHQNILEKNYSSSRQVAFWKKKNEKEKKTIIMRAERYIKSFSI